MKSQIVSIQVLRGLAAFLVVVAHVIEHPMRNPPNAALTTGRFGVEIFFVISGFIIAYVAGRGRFNPAGFMVRRVMRVAPIYWLCTLVVFGLAVLVPSAFKTTVADLGHLLRSLVFIPSPDPRNPNDWRPLFKLGWTLNYEMFFYLALAALFWCRSGTQRTLILSGAMGLLAAGSVLVEPKASVAAFYLNLNLMPFICGVWLAELGARGVFDEAGDAALAVAAALAAAATFVLYQWEFYSLTEPAGHAVMTAAAVLIVTTGLLAERRSRERRLLGLRTIGDASYSLYLTHMFVVGAAWAVMGRFGFSGILAALGGAATVAASIALAILSYRWIETPSNDLGRRLARSIEARGSNTGDGPQSPSARAQDDTAATGSAAQRTS